jgi:hypothetical protein
MMRNETEGQMVLDVTLVPGLAEAVDDWRVARRECQLWGTPETTGLYCEATDQLARALLSDLAAEPRSSEVFERFHNWLVATEPEPK